MNDMDKSIVALEARQPGFTLALMGAAVRQMIDDCDNPAPTWLGLICSGTGRAGELNASARGLYADQSPELNATAHEPMPFREGMLGELHAGRSSMDNAAPFREGALGELCAVDATAVEARHRAESERRDAEDERLIREANALAEEARESALETRMQSAILRDKIAQLEAAAAARAKGEAEAAVQRMVDAGQIQHWDTFTKESFLLKFTSDPSVIPLVTPNRHGQRQAL